MITLLAVFGAGLLFGLGLTLAGMVQPAKVLNFLDPAGTWDPSLALVMAGAVTVAAVAFLLARRLRRPWLAPAFQIPRRRDIDRDLVLGALLFGIGWGMAGLCPGPAVTVALLTGWRGPLFLLALLAGMALADRCRRLNDRR